MNASSKLDHFEILRIRLEVLKREHRDLDDAIHALQERGIASRVIDMRWLSPLPEEALVTAVDGCKHILIVDETRRSGGVAEALVTLFAERTKIAKAGLTAEDSFIATGPSYAATMPSTDQIVASAVHLVTSTAG